jgi:hypothetical protein
MDFVPIPAPITPNAPPLGYSCLEDVLRFFQKLDKNDLPSNGIVVDTTRDILVQRILKGKPGRRSTRPPMYIHARFRRLATPVSISSHERSNRISIDEPLQLLMYRNSRYLHIWQVAYSMWLLGFSLHHPCMPGQRDHRNMYLASVTT